MSVKISADAGSSGSPSGAEAKWMQSSDTRVRRRPSMARSDKLESTYNAARVFLKNSAHRLRVHSRTTTHVSVAAPADDWSPSSKSRAKHQQRLSQAMCTTARSLLLLRLSACSANV